MKTEIGMYALTISTDEAFDDLQNGAKKLNILTTKTPIAGVYQDPNGQYHMFLYRTPIERNDAYHKGKDAGLKTLAYVPTMVYVDADYSGESEEQA